MITRDEVTRLKLRAWIFTGTEVELEMIDCQEELNRWPTSDQRKVSDDYDYEKRRMNRLQKQMELVNKRIAELEAEVGD